MRLIRVIVVASLALATTILGPFSLTGPAFAYESAQILDGSWHIYAKGDDVSISWDVDAEATTTLMVNGEAVVYGNGQGHFYLADQIEGALLDVNLEAQQDLNAGQASAIAQENGITTSAANSSYANIFASRIPFLVPMRAGGVQSASALTLRPDVSIFRYQTFIPQPLVLAPNLACTPFSDRYFFFSGNNRGFDATSSDVKTRMDVWIDWTAGGTFTTKYYVGGTTRWELVNGALLWNASARAGTESMSTTYISKSEDSTAFRMIQAVTNPLCDDSVTLPISFNVAVRVWRDGRSTVSGVAVKVPAHEIYIKDSNSPIWYTISRTDFDGNFFCLTGVTLGDYVFKDLCTQTLSIDSIRG